MVIFLKATLGHGLSLKEMEQSGEKGPGRRKGKLIVELKTTKKVFPSFDILAEGDPGS